MKFRDGYWELKDGVRRFGLYDVIDTVCEKNSFTVVTTCRPAAERAERVGASLLTTVFSSPAPGIIRVRRFHHKGAAPRRPALELPEGVPLDTREEQNEFIIRSGDASARIGRNMFSAAFYYKERFMTSIDARNSGYFISDSGTVLGALEQKAPPAFMAEYLTLSPGENIYGLGERWTAFVKNGQAVDCWNADGGTSSEQAYKNISFYVSDRGYGTYVASAARVSFEVASEVVSDVQFSLSGEETDYYVIGGSDVKDVIRNYTGLTGRPALPPQWSFGLWLSTSFVTDYDEKTVNSFVDGMKERGIPLHVFHFDCFWMRECQWTDFQWDSKQFPNPAEMLSRLKKRGLKICVWINPYIAQKSALFDEAAKNGFLLRRTDGSVWQWDVWQPGMAIVDFTNPAAVKWYAAHLRRLLETGVDCFKTDFGERIPSGDAVWHSGGDAECMHNYYTFLYNKTVFETIEEVRGRGEAVVFARSAVAGSQRFPLHWGGDCSASYASMAETLRGGLSLALGGFGFWSHDISGFEQTASADLFKRWSAFGLLSSHSRLHGNKSYRVPWNFDDEACDVLRFFVKLKCSLMPYLFAGAVCSHTEGIPLMRPMMLEFPNDPLCAFLDMQYMLGPSLLVAPIFNAEGEAVYYLPGGVWTNIISGERVEGGGTRREKHGYSSLPLLAAPGSIIAFGDCEDRPDYDYAANTRFEVFEPEEGREARASVYDSGGKLVTELAVTKKSAAITAVKSGGDKPWRVLLSGIHNVKADSGTIKDTPRGALAAFAGNIKTVNFSL